MKMPSALFTRSFPSAFALIASAILSTSPAHALDLTVAPGGNIQSAIDQVNAAGGGTVNLQAGTHTVTAALLMRSNVTLKGAGTASTTIQNTGAAADYNVISKVVAAVISNVTIRDLAVNGRYSTAGCGLFFDGADASTTNLNLINFEVKNTTNHGVHPKGVLGLTQTNNYIHHSGTISLYHNQYFRRVNDLNVNGSRFDASPAGDGAKFTLWTGAVVTNNTATGNFNRGLRTQDVNTDGSFTYNTVSAQRWDGIEIFAQNTTLANNVAFNNGLDTASANRNGIRTFGGSGRVENNHSYNNPVNYLINGSFTNTNNLTSAPSFAVLQAESYSSMAGIQVETCTDTGGGQHVGFINNNDYISRNSVNLTGTTGINVRVASNNAGGTIEIRLDSVTGPLVGTVAVTNTGGWQTWTTKTGTITGASGIRNVYFVFKGGSSYLFNLNWVQFK